MDTATRVRRLHDHLEATAELPVTSAASIRLGEAAAVVEDVVGEDAPESVRKRRLEQARSLLEPIETTENEEADRHVAAARELLAELLDDA